ncbi:hypothetical protein DFH06DRAFT_1182138 [Mycena polygramma]|nr:hypothetical protein DFH06DRAFT_1182138 [Mycena polygramma]
MDAAALSKLSRAQIIALAKANKIKANLSTKEITRQLLQLFPEGVPHATPSTPASTPKGFVGRVKNALKTISRGGSKAGSRSPGPQPSTDQPETVSTDGVRLETGENDAFKTISRGGSKASRSTNPHKETVASADVPVGSPYSLSLKHRSATTNLLRPPSPVQGNTDVTRDSLETGERALSPTVSAEGPGSSVLPPAAPVPSAETEDVEKEDEDKNQDEVEASRNLAPADPEDIRRLIQDMAAVSARNRRYIEQASAMFLQAKKFEDQVVDFRAAMDVEKERRKRLETYFQHWRPMDTEWSYPEIWDATITVAPVLCRFLDPEVQGSIVMDMEVSDEEDEALVAKWHLQDKKFKARRKLAKRKKAKQRGVDVEMVSDEETGSDEEEFYSAVVLYVVLLLELLLNSLDQTASCGRWDNSRFRVLCVPPVVRVSLNLWYRSADIYLFSDDDSRGILLNRSVEMVVPRAKKRTLDDGLPLDDEARYAPRRRTAIVVPRPRTGEKDHEREIARALGKREFEDDWAPGGVVGGWRMNAE